MQEASFKIKEVAGLARLALTDEEAARYGEQLASVLRHVEQLQSLDVNGIEPMAHGAPVYNVVREDAERPSLPVAEALANAPQKGNDLILMPRMVE
jgi:aspartyl-tRNA(Asn)/glutamyl-tRNA(Gln) amidotransferase subunit C